MTVECKKAEAEVYKLRIKEEYSSWANITLEQWENGGSIGIISDYGNYSYAWGSVGSGGFKRFLIGVDYGYFMGKCLGNHGEIFCSRKSADAVREDILKARRNDDIDLMDARECYDEVRSQGLDDVPKDVFFERIYNNTKIASLIYGGDPHSIPSVHESDYQAKAFWDRVWPHFCDILRKEVAVGEQMVMSIKGGMAETE